MSETAVELIDDLVHAVRLPSESSFTWLGRITDELPPRLFRQLSPAQVQKQLRMALSRQIYRNFYLTGRVTAAEPPRPPSGSRYDLLRRVNAANHGHGCWSPGWLVLALASQGLATVRRQGLELIVPVDKVSAEPEPGQTVSIRLPKSLPGASPGFYYVLGDISLDDLEAADDRLARIYWNIKSAAACDFVDAITLTLNEAQIAFEMKVLDDPSAYVRCDSGVLYLHESAFGDTLGIVGQVAEHLRGGLRPGRPALTGKLAAGVGYAFDPGTGESYGQAISRILAEGLVLAGTDADDGGTDGARRDVVFSHLSSAGVDVGTPWLAHCDGRM